MILTARQLRSGETPPWGYGLAYRLYDRDAAVFYPFPVNHIVGFCRWAWYALRDCHYPMNHRDLDMAKAAESERARRVLEEYLRRHAYCLGYKHGRLDGARTALGFRASNVLPEAGKIPFCVLNPEDWVL